MQIQSPKTEQPITPLRISKRALQQVMRVNPALAAGRSLGEFQDYLERGGSMQLSKSSRSAAQALPPHSYEPQITKQEELEQALGFFVKSQADEAEATLAELETERRRIEAAMVATRAHAQGKIKSFINMLDPVVVAQYGHGALMQQSKLLGSLGMTPTNLLNP